MDTRQGAQGTPLSFIALLSSGDFIGPGKEALVEGEGLRLSDDYGGEVGVGGVQQVVVLALDDGARNLEHGAPLALDPLVACPLELWWSRVGTPVTRQPGAVQALHEGVVEARGDERVGGEEGRLP